jgi:hypothetical protein
MDEKDKQIDNHLYIGTFTFCFGFIYNLNNSIHTIIVMQRAMRPYFK